MQTIPEYNAVPFDKARMRLMQLWHDAFGDEHAYIERFFALSHAEDNLHTISLNGKVVSALYALPYRILYNGTEYPVAYIYAVTTDAGYRGRGYMPLLMRHVHTTLSERGYAASILVPAASWLHRYYESMGYSHCSYRRLTIITPEKKLQRHNAIINRSRDTDGICRFMEERMRMQGCALIHTHASIAMNIYNCEQSGGAVYSATDDRGCIIGSAFVTVDNGRPVMTNLTCSDELTKKAFLQRVCTDFSTANVMCIETADDTGTPFGMIFRFEKELPESFTMTLMLDK